MDILILLTYYYIIKDWKKKIRTKTFFLWELRQIYLHFSMGWHRRVTSVTSRRVLLNGPSMETQCMVWKRGAAYEVWSQVEQQRFQAETLHELLVLGLCWPTWLWRTPGQFALLIHCRGSKYRLLGRLKWCICLRWPQVWGLNVLVSALLYCSLCVGEISCSTWTWQDSFQGLIMFSAGCYHRKTTLPDEGVSLQDGHNGDRNTTESPSRKYI